MNYNYPVTIHLNARFQPVHRFELEDALDSIFEKLSLGNVSGGGTLQMKTGEIKSCDIEIMLKDGNKQTIEKLKDILHSIGVPMGSEIIFEDSKIPVGTLEGLALYLNGTELPNEIYKTCDINYVIDELNKLMSGVGSMYSCWEGLENTGLYFYGSSYNDMLSKIQPFLNEYPLCQKCKAERIA